MTWLWRTCFSLAAVAAPAAAATISGAISLADSREPSVRRKDFSGVVVWLEPVGRSSPLPAPGVFTMRQKGKRFIPHVLAIPAGSMVDFPNLDPIFHNAFSNFAGQPFDTGLYAPGTSQRIVFRREGTVRVFCNIHSAMSAVILVLRTSHFAVTGPDGRFQLEGVPPGDYQFRVWHERASDATLEKLERRLTVANATVTVGPIVISESGYLELPHKNKFGRDYPPEPRPGYRVTP